MGCRVQDPANKAVPDSQAQMELGRSARARGDHVAALEHFAAAAAVASPRNPWPRLEQAATLHTLGRGEEAEALYMAVLADHPGQAKALLGLGHCARARGDHVAALEHFAAAAAASPHTALRRH